MSLEKARKFLLRSKGINGTDPVHDRIDNLEDAIQHIIEYLEERERERKDAAKRTLWKWDVFCKSSAVEGFVTVEELDG